VQQFDDAAWQLPPGGVTGVVRTAFGFHIIRRPPLAEVKDSFRLDLQNRVAARFDSVYLDKLAKDRKVSVSGGAPAVVRQAMGDAASARRDGTTLVSYRGGKLRVRDMMRWVYSLPPDNAQALPYASDDQIKEFLKIIAQREILLMQADSAHVQLRPADWQQLFAQHDSLVAGLTNALGLSPAVLRDSAASPAQRAALAAGHVNDYMDRLVQGRASYVPVSAFFSDALRRAAPWSLSAPGVQRAADRAKVLRAAADSLRSRSGGGGPIRPAPGPAPGGRPLPPKRSLQ
jgi:PPIC-type peptidyl-prolyl cis-trans isomerase-like protein